MRPLVLVDAGASTVVAITSPVGTSSGAPRARPDNYLCGHRHRQPQYEFRSFTRLGANRDVTRVLLHNAVRHRETEPGAVLVFFGGEKRVEYARQNVGWDAASRVLNSHGALVGRRIEVG